MYEISKFCRAQVNLYSVSHENAHGVIFYFQVRRGTADRFGVVFFNVSKDDQGTDVLLELVQPDVKFIKTLDKIQSRECLRDFGWGMELTLSLISLNS
jgi:hypothetical protein